MRAPVGRLRRKMAALLDALGVEITPEDIWLQDPALRMPQRDCASWGATVRWKPESEHGGLWVQLYSYERMIDCAKRGITLDHRGTWPMQWTFVEINVNPKPQVTP